jgi:hypothetical protein
MKIVNTAIAAAMLSSSVIIGSGVASAASFQALPTVENAGVTEAHYRHYRHRYHRCYTTLVKRYHHWVRVTRCRW